MFQIIAKEQVTFPALPSVPNSLKNLLTSLLQKDFKLRITMEGIRHHPWVLSGLSNSSRAKFLHDTDPSCDSIQPIVVSEEEVKNAVGIMGKIKKRMRKMSTSLSGLLGYSTRQPKNGSRPNLEVSSSQPDTSTNLFSHLTLDDPVAAEKERILQWNTFSQ